VALKEVPFHKCACLIYCYGMDKIIKYNVEKTSNGIMFIPSSVKISPFVWKLQEGTDSTGTYFLTLRKESTIKIYHYMRIQFLCTLFSHWLSLRDQCTITYCTRSFPHHKQTTAHETKTRCAYQKNTYCYVRHRPVGLKGSSCNAHTQHCAAAASSSHRF
jgi:hypothetical protein